jgi:hypothetical protein
MSNNSTLLLFVPETINMYFLRMKIILCHFLDLFKFDKFLYVKPLGLFFKSISIKFEIGLEVEFVTGALEVSLPLK